MSIFGTPGSADPWSWRFEGRRCSVSMTVVGSAVSPAPVFFGANPARVSYGAHTVSRPLAPEEDVAFALLAALSPTERSLAVFADVPPVDVLSGTSPLRVSAVAFRRPGDVAEPGGRRAAGVAGRCLPGPASPRTWRTSSARRWRRSRFAWAGSGAARNAALLPHPGGGPVDRVRQHGRRQPRAHRAAPALGRLRRGPAGRAPPGVPLKG